jgi:hypothetical protein
LLPKHGRPGELSGKLGPYGWRFFFERDDDWEHVNWNWGFAVIDEHHHLVYQASAENAALWFDLPTVESLIGFVQYQAQQFLEEHLHQAFDAGSSARHRKPPKR